MNLCWITFDDVTKKNVRVISIKNRVKYFPKHWKITIISPSVIEDKELKSYITKNIAIGERIYSANFKSPTMLLKLIKNLKRISKEIENFDLILTDTIYVPFYKYFSKKKIPLVMLSHGIVSEEALIKNLIKDCITYRSLRIIEKNAYKKCDKIITVTDGIKEYLINEFYIDSSKITVIPNAVDPDLFKPFDKKKCITGLKLNENNYYVCFIGQLVPWQGIENLVKAAALILRDRANTTFLVVGDGPLKKKLVNLTVKNNISDKFIFTGMVPHNEIPKYINASDICVAPFVKERNEKIGLSPLKIFEYAACGKPIVVSKISNLEFIEETNAGVMVEPEKPEEIRRAIIDLFKNPKLQKKMGKNGRDYILKNFTWAGLAKQFEKVCMDAIKHKNN